MTDFVDRESIVRRIWGNGDVILLVFAGSAAEFALNRAVDWLFFTGKLPGDPIGRLFSTARYAQDIVFADQDRTERTLGRIRAAHQKVEDARQGQIPDWAHRDVLYMLIDYSERAYALLHRRLTAGERDDLYDVFRRVGDGLHIPDLPATYADWKLDRQRHLERDLVRSEYTAALYDRYRQHLGRWRYGVLRQVQGLLVPEHVRSLLSLGTGAWIRPLLPAYSVLVRMRLRSLVQWLLMPAEHLPAVRDLDQPGGAAPAAPRHASPRAGAAATRA